MKKLVKYGVSTVVVLILIVVIGVVVLYFNRNRAAKAAIEEALSYALDVEVTVDSVNLSLFSGEASITGLKVANPKGFEGGEALAAGARVLSVTPHRVSLESVFMSTIEQDDADQGGS